ncbi:MAG TPA: ABC transporter permease [Polyangiaceae bacterium]|nr:ABC transporter permease [Polyangiaceae bacterium]
MGGALTQMHVVLALLLRETKTRFGDNQLGYLWAFISQGLMVGMFIAFYSVFGRIAPSGLSLVAYLTTGIVPYSLFRDTAQRCMAAVDSNKGLLFYPQVRPLDLVIARALLEAVTYLGVMALFLGGLALYEGPPRIDSFLRAFLGFALASGFGATLGLLSCGLSIFTPTVERLFPSVLRVIFWFSAVFHPVESLPKTMRSIILWNPLTHALELVRSGWFPGYDARSADPSYALMWILVLAFCGLSLERMARRRLELT